MGGGGEGRDDVYVRVAELLSQEPGQGSLQGTREGTRMKGTASGPAHGRKEAGHSPGL